MITEIFNSIKHAIIKSDIDKINALNTELEHLNQKEKYLHNHYEINISTIVKADIRSAFEDAHFDDIAEIIKAKKEISNELSNLKVQFLDKASKNLKYKKHLKKSLNKKRTEMPQISASNVSKFLKTFENKDINIEDKTVKLNDIKPSQEEFNEDKVLHFINEYLEKEPNNEYLLSSDGYLIDGHHRWAAELQLYDASKQTKAKVINLPADELISQANKLKITKTKDIDDKTFKKSIEYIAKALDEGFLTEDIQNLLKAKRKAGLIPVRRVIVKNGRPFSQVFWVRPEKDDLPDVSALAENEEKDRKLFERQKNDDLITNVGDVVDVNYIGRLSKKRFKLNKLKVVGITDNEIEVEVPQLIKTAEKYSDGQNIVFRKGARLKIPKTTNPKWSNIFNYTLAISSEERENRMRQLKFLEEIRDYAKKAKEKGYSVFERALSMSDAQIEARYAPFFSKYGYDFDPIRMFDNAKKAIKQRFRGVNIDMTAQFDTFGFKIRVKDKDTGADLMYTNRDFRSGHELLPANLRKGIYHAYFKIYQVKYWGGGLAKKLFSSYYHEYKKMGLQFLSVTAGLESGPFVWPDYGFRGTLQKAESVLNHFTPGNKREISKYYVETQDPAVEKAWKDGNKIWIKFIDSDEPVNVTNEKLKLDDGTEVKKYDVDSYGYVHIPAYTKTHTITEEESARATKLYWQWREKNPGKTLFPFTVWTTDAKLRDASKVALLKGGSGGYVVNLADEENRKDFERRIKYKEWLKENNIKE